jgi:glutamine synthetase
MAQLGADFPGLSQHVHVSLRDADSARNLFTVADTPQGIFAHFIAGMLELIPQAMPFTHPTPNSYRRIAPGNWAPKAATWAEQNYAAAVRVVSRPAEHCRIEYRLPGADANPYLNLAFVLGAGLWGIEHALPLPLPFLSGSPDTPGPDHAALPHDLFSAIERLARSRSAFEIWGESFVRHLCTVLSWEEASLRRHASAAERARYLEIV